MISAKTWHALSGRAPTCKLKALSSNPSTTKQQKNPPWFKQNVNTIIIFKELKDESNSVSYKNHEL
jgi:hypothetical protein